MRLPPGPAIQDFVELRFKAHSSAADGIPSQGCRIRKQQLEELLSNGGSYDVDDLIYGLMDWPDVTDEPGPALATLRALLDRHYPSDGRVSASCRFSDEMGIDRTLRVGPVDSSGDVVAWQRRGWVVALAQASQEEPGRMQVGAPGPITLRIAQRLLALGMTTFMGEPFDSYAGAQTMSRSTAACYAWEAGEATACHWEYGLAKRIEGGRIVDCSAELEELPGAGWLPPNQLAIMIGMAAGYLK